MRAGELLKGEIMGEILYLECSSGISGDMCAAALLDVGASEEKVRRALESLPICGFEVRITRVLKSGLDVCDFDVVLDDAHENHDHDMAYLHGHTCEHEHAGEQGNLHPHEHEQGHGHEHEHAHVHGCELARGRAHEHGHAHEHERELAHAHEHDHEDSCAYGLAHEHAHEHGHADEGAHEHRGLAEVRAVIDAADMTPGAKLIACRIFDILAEAEAAAHGCSADQVHFHEVGAVDSIADIVAISVAVDDLSPCDVVVTELTEGRGTVRCQHGLIPVPVPAVVNIARAHGLTLRMTDVCGELVTPTGAAVAAATRTRETLPERFKVKRAGMGAGKRAYDTPGILRAMLIEPAE